eukprot:2806134-Rhodomonas_salina.1
MVEKMMERIGSSAKVLDKVILLWPTEHCLKVWLLACTTSVTWCPYTALDWSHSVTVATPVALANSVASTVLVSCAPGKLTLSYKQNSLNKLALFVTSGPDIMLFAHTLSPSTCLVPAWQQSGPAIEHDAVDVCTSKHRTQLILSHQKPILLTEFVCLLLQGMQSRQVLVIPDGPHGVSVVQPCPPYKQSSIREMVCQVRQRGQEVWRGREEEESETKGTALSQEQEWGDDTWPHAIGQGQQWLLIVASAPAKNSSQPEPQYPCGHKSYGQ